VNADPQSLLPVAFQAIDTASQLIRSRPAASVTEKSDRDLVSDVDVAIERAVRGYLASQTPGIGFLGEEEGRSGDPASGWLWTLDPIDGTSNFAHGIPLCAISLALLRDGRPVLAVIDAPFLRERYHAAEGHGAYSGGTRLAASTTTRLRDAIVAIGDYAVGPQAARKNEVRLAATVQLTSRVHRIRMLGTAALDLAWVAAGRLDASITLSNNPWDTAAGVLIAREAGATVTDADGTQHALSSAATIAATPSLISQLVSLIRTADLGQAPSADPDATESPNVAPSPHAALDGILSQARHLIFDFDGPICDLTAAMPADTADQLRATLRAAITHLPQEASATSDPRQVLACAAKISPDLATQIDAQLTSIEMAAAMNATPAGYVHEAIAACQDSGRTPAVIGWHSMQAVIACLTAYDLADWIKHVTGTTTYPPGHLSLNADLLADAIAALNAAPDECALITASSAGIDAARATGSLSIGYALTPAARQHLSTAGAGAVILSLADLTLTLRARPLPN
jgi:myo-inositol-1(or 4)-monophosphatase